MVKMLWYVRIAADAFPDVKEQDYLKNNRLGVTPEELSDKLANSILFKMVYHRFGEI